MLVQGGANTLAHCLQKEGTTRFKMLCTADAAMCLFVRLDLALHLIIHCARESVPRTSAVTVWLLQHQPTWLYYPCSKPNALRTMSKI